MKVSIRLRKAEAADANAVGDICYRAFKVLAESHHFTPDFPSADLASSMLAEPTRNGELLRWCLAEGLGITQTMTLMTVGLYNQPDGVWLPSVIY
jgi:hypothetical protein